MACLRNGRGRGPTLAVAALGLGKLPRKSCRSVRVNMNHTREEETEERSYKEKKRYILEGIVVLCDVYVGSLIRTRVGKSPFV